MRVPTDGHRLLTGHYRRDQVKGDGVGDRHRIRTRADCIDLSIPRVEADVGNGASSRDVGQHSTLRTVKDRDVAIQIGDVDPVVSRIIAQLVRRPPNRAHLGRAVGHAVDGVHCAFDFIVNPVIDRVVTQW